MSQEYEINDYTVSPYLVYPPSQTELNAFASKLNMENLKSKIFLVTAKDDAIADSVSAPVILAP